MTAFPSVNGSGQSGAHSVSNIPSILQVPVVDSRLLEIEPDAAIFDTLLRLSGKAQRIENQTFYWREVAPYKNKTTVLATVNSSATTITFADTSFMVPGVIIENLENHERIYVPKGSTITNSTGSVGANIVRGVEGTTAATWTVGDRVLVMSSNYEEGQDKRNSMTREQGTLYNYTEGFDGLIELTEETMNTGTFGEGELDRQERLSLRNYKKEMNLRLLVGKRGVLTSTTTGITKPVYTTNGLRPHCMMYNNIDVGPGVTRKTITDGIARIAANAGVRGVNYTAICAPKVHGILSQLDESYRRTTRTDRRIGAIVNEIEGTEGMITIVVDHTLSLPGYDEEMLVFTEEQLHLKDFTPFTVRANVQDNGSRRYASQMYQRTGLQVDLPSNTGRLFNIKYAA